MKPASIQVTLGPAAVPPPQPAGYRPAGQVPGAAPPQAGVASGGAMSAPGLPALIVRVDAHDGSFSKRLRVARSDVSAVLEAADALANLRSGAEHMTGRTWHVDEARVMKDPLRPSTGLAIFDKAAQRSCGFMNGNVTSNVQTSTFIRAHSRLECNGFLNAPGHLRQFDLKAFGASRFPGSAVPHAIMAALNQRPDQDTILYKIFHTMQTNAVDVHGWILTGVEGEHILTVDKFHGCWARPSQASQRVLQDAEDAFTMRTIDGSRRPLLRIDGGIEVLVDPRVEAAVDQARRSVLSDSQDDSDEPDEDRSLPSQRS